VVCNLHNLGVAGAAWTAFNYAFTNDYEWVWVLDQDSVPRSEALRKLVDLYDSFTPETQRQTGVLSSLSCCPELGKELHGVLLTRHGHKIPRLSKDDVYYECDATIWSGSLYKLGAIRAAGPPRIDFWMDWDDLELGFRIKAAGYRVFVHRASLIHHTIGEVARCRWWRSRLWTRHPAKRMCMRYRNMTYFWLYLHTTRCLSRVLLCMTRTFLSDLVKFVLTEKHPWPKIHACLLGVWNGWTKNLDGEVRI
jgi:rhamnosyltransferase